MGEFYSTMPPFDTTLFILGIIFFLVLLVLLIWSVVKAHPFKALTPFFLLPVFMIAYPSVRSISFSGILVETNNQVKAVTQNPADSSARKSLENDLAKLKSSNLLSKSERGLTAVASAQIALGKYDSASLYLDRANNLNPASKEVPVLRKELNYQVTITNNFLKNISSLNEQIRQLQQSPGNSQSLNNIAQILTSIRMPPYVQPNDILTLAKSYAITGNTQQSLEAINKLSEVSSENDMKLNLLKDSISGGDFQKQFFRGEVHPKYFVKPGAIRNNLLSKVAVKR